MSSLRRAWAGLLVALIVLVTLAAGCARDVDPGPLWADPGVVQFDAERVEAAVEIHNISDTARPITFALVGPDWGSLRFLDESFPRTVPAHQSVVVRLAISRATLRSQPGVYRSGHAGLRIESDQHAWEIPIEFVGTAERESGAPPAWLAIGVLALIGVGVTTLAKRGRTGATPSVRTSGRTSADIALAGALAAMLLVVATLPWGPGVCLGRSGARVGPAELAQCRAGFAGFELTLAPADPGVWWLLIGLTLAAGLTALARSRGSRAGPPLALALVRVLGFGLILASLMVGLAPTSATTVDLVLAQLRPEQLAGFPIPAWGGIAQPISFVAGFALVVVPKPDQADATVHVLHRFEGLIAAALLTVLFLGGWAVPGLSDRPVPPLTHAGMLGVELVGFVAKIALVDLGLRTLANLLARRDVDSAQLLRTHARYTLPLLFANLLAISLWRVF